MTPMAIAMVTGATVKSIGTLMDLSTTGVRKDAIRLSAESKKTALKLNNSLAKTDILYKQKAIDSQLIDYMGATKMDSYSKGYSSIESLYALSRSANIVKEKNKNSMNLIDSNLNTELFNVDIEKIMQQSQLQTSNLSGVLNSIGSGIEAYGYAKYGG